MREGGEQPRHPDGEAGRRHRLAAKARHEAVVAAAAADGAEADGGAVVAGGREGEFDLVDGAGVVLKAAANNQPLNRRMTMTIISIVPSPPP